MGYFLALLSAVFEAVKISLAKQIINEVDEYWLSWLTRLIPALLLLPLVLASKPPSLGNQFWLVFIFIAVTTAVDTVLYLKAVKAGPISLSAPMQAFGPLFLLVSGPLILGELPSSSGLLGVGLIVAGSYILNLKAGVKSIWQPFQAILQQPGTRLMLLVTLIWSLEATFHKIGLLNSSVVFWTFAQFAGPAIALTPVVLFRRSKAKCDKKIWLTIFLIGLIIVLGQLAQMTSLKSILAVYSIAIKRTSIFFTVLLGWWFFKETDIKKRLAGAVLMVVGVLLISLYA